MAEEFGTDIIDTSDESLLRRINKGNHDAFTELVRRHSRRYYSIAYRLLFSRDDAEDIVQEAFLKLWRRPGSFNQSKGTKFTTWFYRVVANLCLDHNRKKKSLPLNVSVQIPDGGPGQELLLDKRQKQAMLDRYVSQLPERQQLALNLCFFEGLSNQEAAEIIGVELKALQSLIMRAKTTLREKMKDLGM